MNEAVGEALNEALNEPAPLFAETAQRLWGLAATVLRWPPDIFWTATPAELVSAFPTDPEAAPQSMTRAEIERLMKGHENG